MKEKCVFFHNILIRLGRGEGKGDARFDKEGAIAGYFW